MSTEEWLTPKELAARWKVAEKTLAQWRYQGIGPKFRKLGGIRYAASDVMAYESERAA